MKKKNIFNNFSQKHRKFIFGGHTLTLFAVLFLLILPQITQLFIDSVYSSSGTKEANFGVLWGLLTNGQVLNLGQIVLWLSISFVLVAILKNVCTFFASQCYFLGASRSRSALRRACFKKLSFLDNSISVKQTFFNFTSDVADFSDIFYRHRPKMFDSLAKIVIAGLLCILIDKQIALGFLILVPIVFLVGVTLEKKLVEKHSEARNRKSIMFGASEDLIENIKEIKTFGAEDWAIEKYSTYNQSHTTTIVGAVNLVQRHKFWLGMLRGIGIFMAAALSAFACFKGLISVGYFVLFVTYAVVIFDASNTFMTSFYDCKVSSISAKRLGKFLDTPTKNQDNLALLPPTFDIELKNVVFTSQGQEVFKDLSLSIKYGTHIALLMGDNQGKTSLARMLLKFLNPTSGEILFAGNPQNAYNISSVRKGFSFVAQEPAIFEGTIADNITMFEKIDEIKLEKAIKFSGLEPTIKSLKNNVNHFLVESGKNMPSQIRQKIMLARALYRDAPVLLIDSAFNKFDTEEAQALLEKILKAYKGKTVIYLTEEPLLAQKMKKVVCIENGSVKK